MDPKDTAQAQLDETAPKPGRYRHYKGGEYEVLPFAYTGSMNPKAGITFALAVIAFSVVYLVFFK